ncbi:MAG: S4 domain-containing protein [Pseudomonadota bacterium]
MRLNVFLSLSVAMSRNQAKFFIQKGRLSVDGNVVTDPYFDVAEENVVTFDGKPISVTRHRYIVLHKPASYACTSRDADHPTALALLKNRTESDYFYFANVLGPDQTGLVLVSDDARWANRLKRRLLTKPRVYTLRTMHPLSDDHVQALNKACAAPEDDRHAPVVSAEKHADDCLQLKTAKVEIQALLDSLALAGIENGTLHLQQIGRLELGNLAAGDYLDLNEDEIKI